MEIIEYPHLNQLLKDHGLWVWGHELETIVRNHLTDNPHGRTERWLQTLAKLPDIPAEHLQLNAPSVTVTTDQAVDTSMIHDELMTMFPWRKGPFNIHGVLIDTEWRSDMKWERVQPHISPLKGRRVLDIGCGNGYYMWRMLGAGARCVIGVDPMRLYCAQFQAIRHFLGKELPVTLLPTPLEPLPMQPAVFDSVFSMGVLYHRRDPVAHIEQLKQLARPGGEIILETLVIDDRQSTSLQPEERYAQMRNVWHIPSIALLNNWMQNAGLHDIRIIDVSPTTIEEQRTTEWMPFHSLADFLDHDDPSKTVEGYPAPLRAVAVANAL